MATQYGQALTTQSDILQEETRAMGEVGSKDIKTKEFQFDKTIEYNEAAKEAAKTYSTWKNWLTAGATLLVASTGVGIPLAMAMAGGGAFAAGKYGEYKAKQELEGMDWYKGSQEDLAEGMEKQTQTGAMTSAVLAGIGAHAGKTAGTAKDVSSATMTIEQNAMKNLSIENATSYVQGMQPGSVKDAFLQKLSESRNVAVAEGLDQTAAQTAHWQGLMAAPVQHTGPGFQNIFSKEFAADVPGAGRSDFSLDYTWNLGKKALPQMGRNISSTFSGMYPTTGAPDVYPGSKNISTGTNWLKLLGFN